jgi:hypothetical protein
MPFCTKQVQMRFTLSLQCWIDTTNALGIESRSGHGDMEQKDMKNTTMTAQRADTICVEKRVITRSTMKGF